MTGGAVRILGIDPGLRQTGWGVIDAENGRLSFVSAGTIRTQGEDTLAERLVQLHHGLEEIVRDGRATEAAVETSFVNRDAKATLKLGHARGIALVVPSMAGLAVFEYAPNAIKKSVTGVGHGDKRQVQTMIGMLLPRAIYDTEHAADALAVAICHAHMRDRIRLEAGIEGGVPAGG